MSSSVVLPDPKSSRVVLVGVSDYEHLEPLPAVADSLVDLTEALRSPRLWGVPENHSVMLHNPAGADVVLDAVREAAGAARDTLLLYYAGHGLPDPFSGELDLTLPGSIRDKQETLLAYEWIRRPMLASRARRRIVILDSCYSGRILPRTMSAPSLADKAGIEGVFLIAASAPNSEALSPPGARHTAFSGELLRILREGIPEAGPALDLRTIFAELDRALTRNSLPRPQSSNRNTAGSLGLVWNSHRFPAPPATAPMPAAGATDADGLLIDGYELGERLGGGADTSTWLARGRRALLPVAVTVLRDDRVGDAAASARFHAWRNSLHSGDPHPSIARVHADGEARHWKGARPYVVLEYLPGTLQDRLASDGLLPLAEAVAVVRAVLEGLRHAQAADQDGGRASLTPDTLRTGLRGGVKIVRFHRPPQHLEDPDRVGLAFPTPTVPLHQLSPEQAMGGPGDARSDVYAVGCLFYELLSGSRPFDSEHAVTLAHRHMTEPAPRLSALRGQVVPLPRWEKVLAKALMKDPRLRYRDAEDMLAALTACEQAPFTLAEAIVEAFREKELTIDASFVNGRWLGRALRDAAAEVAAGAPAPRTLNLRLLLPSYDTLALLTQRELMRAASEDAAREVHAEVHALREAGRVTSARVEVRRALTVSSLFVLGERIALEVVTESQPLRRWNASEGADEASVVAEYRSRFDKAWHAAAPCA
ncbi:caspase family protein [Streptomyces sp. NBC_01336]|uniref:caspase, EACC1-associated type n=1 Tax=Streptomyces sp. NBC_01336 TaxID=2903829 RepID=UPI002E13FE3E|nr:caspase family protein [Streptomyces sp. NBC_01336]